MKHFIKLLVSGHVVTSVVLYGLLALMLTTTNPYQIAPFFLFVPFVLFFVATLLLLYRSIIFAARALRLELPAAVAFRISFLFSGLPTFLLLLQSIGKVGAYDILVTIILFAALDFYVARQKLGVKNV